MFGYRSNVPKVLNHRPTVVRLVHDRDARRLADYYAGESPFQALGSQCATKATVIHQAGRPC